MIAELKNIKSELKDLKKFSFTIGTFLLVVSIVLFIYNKNYFEFFLGSGLILIFLGLIKPIITKPIYLLWMGLATIIGWFMTRVILSILFYFITTPISIILRLFGKDFLNIKSNDSNSYWNLRDSEVEKNQDYEKQF